MASKHCDRACRRHVEEIWARLCFRLRTKRMTERDLPPSPEPDKYASCPLDGRVLDYYKGAFDSVYVLLHPFERPRSTEPEWI